MWKAGQLPFPSEQLSTGTIIVKEVTTPAMPSDSRLEFLRRISERIWKHKGRLAVYAHHHGWTIVQAVSEVGSGLNGTSPQAHPTKMQAIVVAHRDRLMRFGAEYVEAALAAQGRTLIVMERSEVKDDLVQDMIEVLTSFCARLYERRSARNKTERAMQAIGR